MTNRSEIRRWNRIAVRTLAAATFCIALAAGCVFSDLKREMAEFESTFSLHGRIEGIARAQGDVFVLLFAQKEEGLVLQSYTLPDDTGTYSFFVSPGEYQVAAFEDRNQNRHHDPGEPAGAWGRPDTIVVSLGEDSRARDERLADLDFSLEAGPFPLPEVDSSFEKSTRMSASLFKLGVLAGWGDPIFDDAHGGTGFWKPLTFLKQQGIGIYFMQPYQPGKIPILFVHGASGTPRGWRTLAESLDRERFQPWVFYYPSGLRLDQITDALNEMVKRLQLDYGFDRMGVVAHSMGGLVSRGFIIRHLVEDGLGTVKAFVSISTPWGGVEMAAKGVENAPAAIPSWHDVAPQSDYIRRIFADPLSPKVPHTLIFGYRGDCSLFMANNDGTVEVSSELDLRAQDDAAVVLGLNEDHMSILTSKKTIAYLRQALDSAFPQPAP